MPSPNAITPAQLMRLIGTPDAPVIIDVRIPENIAEDPALIPGAFQHAHGDITSLAASLVGKSVVVSCKRGGKLSDGAVALLLWHGITAEKLQGGSLAWRAAGLPMVPLSAVPATNLWVTRHRPKIDRVACPWLIRRFVDPTARFLFVTPSDVMDVAEMFNATPFDVDGVPWSHRDDRCTFDTMLDTFHLHTDALDRLALVVRAADTDRHDLAPQAAGLLAVSVGLSRMFRDDLAQLEAAMGLYDALYRWARDGHEEGHDWPAGHNP